MLFEGFTLHTTGPDGQPLRYRRGGAGPPLLLLHGNPQTHAMWHRVAPVLARTHTVICPDLRGYGFSARPPTTSDHASYAKRAMAADLLALMRAEGFPQFGIVAHDRGARVAHRLALDAPDAVERLAVLDIVPTIEHFERITPAFALGYYHWFFLAAPHPIPERMMERDMADWFRLQTSREPKGAGFWHPEALADYLAALAQPDAALGICEDYRAAAGIDLEHDRASRAAGLRVRCPMLSLWGAKGRIGVWYEPLRIWRDYCDAAVTGGPVNSGHYLAEEAPEEVLGWLHPFLAS